MTPDQGRLDAHGRNAQGLVTCPEEYESDGTVDLRQVRCPHFLDPLRYERRIGPSPKAEPSDGIR